GDGGAASGGNSRARLRLTCRFMATCAEVARPDQHMPANQLHLTNHCRDSRSTTEIQKLLDPEFRTRLLQNTAEPNSADLPGETGRVIGLDGKRAQRRGAGRRLELGARQLA